MDICKQGELLKVTHELQQANLDDQAREELECGCYIPMSDTEIGATVRTSIRMTFWQDEIQQVEVTLGPLYILMSGNVNQSVSVERVRSLQPNPLQYSPLHQPWVHNSGLKLVQGPHYEAETTMVVPVPDYKLFTSYFLWKIS